MQCAIVNRQICQRLNSPTTQNTMLQIIDRYSSRILTKRNSNDSQKGATQYENKENMLQESIIKLNSDVHWNKQVTWHQWQYILLDNGDSDTKKK